ncbi:MAG: hypothetical protein DDT29_01494 [Dehalococcoidia bacterium]|nr:hypothetical protein [Bacillota bacterium]
MSKGQVTPRLKVNLSELEAAFEDTSWERSGGLLYEPHDRLFSTQIS